MSIQWAGSLMALVCLILASLTATAMGATGTTTVSPGIAGRAVHGDHGHGLAGVTISVRRRPAVMTSLMTIGVIGRKAVMTLGFTAAIIHGGNPKWYR